jgi:hypothetical protein
LFLVRYGDDVAVRYLIADFPDSDKGIRRQIDDFDYVVVGLRDDNLSFFLECVFTSLEH